MKKMFRKEMLIGVSVLIALAILIFGIDFLKGVNVFQPTNYYLVSYTDVNGLAVSAPVTVNGFKVGQVRNIEYEYDNPGHVLVELALDNKLRVPRGSKALLTTDMLGTSTITLVLAPATGYHDVGDRLIGEQPKGLMGTVTDDLLPSITPIFPKVDTLLTDINALVASPALLASLQRLDAITASLEVTSRQLQATTAALPAVAADAKNITGNFVTTSRNFVTTSDNLAQFSGRVNALPVDSIANHISATVANLQQLTAELRNPNSTLGLLMNDPALYNNLNRSISSLDSLFVDIKAHPKRYINIKIF